MRWLFFLAASPLFSAYIGNPASPGIMDTGIFSVRNPFVKGSSGYIADYTSDKNYVAPREPTLDPEIHRFGIHSQLASFSIILLERLELVGTTGGSKERVKWSQEDSITDPNAILVDFQSSYHFSWSAGAKVILLQWGQTFFCADFTYFSVPSSSHSFFKFFNRLNLPLNSEKQGFYLREWQTSFALASRFACLTPYVGGIYLNSHLHVESGPEVGPIFYKNDDKFGWFYGVTLSITGRLHFNFERRQGTESAYAFSSIAVF